MTTFSDEHIAGQRLMLGFDGAELNSGLKYLIREMKIGGIILFSRNIPGSPQNPEQLKQLCQSAQEYAASCGQPPLFISIDQEGGRVARLKSPFTQFSGNPVMKSEDDAEIVAKTMASELNSVGINMNLAPVMDIADDKSLMADRVFGNDPQWVSRMGVKMIETLQANSIMAVAKHFPGIGRTSLDSHLDLPISDAAKSEMDNFELLPFNAAVQHKTAGIMLSHVLYKQLDPDFPASLSVPIARDLLRREMGFDGLVMTDDLDMGAIAKHYDLSTCIRQILLAEIDIVLISAKSPNVETAFEEILKNFMASQDIKAKGLSSFNRILETKHRYLNLTRRLGVRG
jgi:beta-N-acetylhexosaminidase